MDDELKHVRITVLLHVVVAVIIAWVSVIVSSLYGDIPTILLGLVVLWGLGKATNKVVGGKDVKWWLSNGVFIYLFAWLISWIVFCNVMGAC